MNKIVEIAMEECANFSIAELVQIFAKVGGKDEQTIREEVLRVKWRL